MKYVKFFLIIIIICLTSTGCIKEDIEKKQITRNAKEYFSSKYNINKSKIKIESNNFYGPNEKCWMSCGENEAKIIYNEKTYKIRYDESRENFGDDYQFEKISNDFNKYLSEKFPYAKTIKIDMLEYDVLATPTKYIGNIENYIKNTIIKTSVDNSSYTLVKIWIEATDSNQAKELHRRYRKELITELENLGISYNISFSNKEGSNEYSSFYYYTVSDGGRRPAFMYWDRVDNTGENYLTTKSCDEKSIDFKDDEIICR